MADNSFHIKSGSINLQPGSAPSNPVYGDMYADSSGVFYRYNGSAWVAHVDLSTAQTLTNKSVDADSNTLTNIANAAIKAGAAIDAAKIADGSVSNAEFQRLDGVTSAIQTQLNTKITASSTDTLTNKSIDAATNILTNIDNAAIKSTAAIDVSKIANGLVSNTEFQYLDGVTSAIQTQLNAKITASSSDVLTNKSIDADSNTITNIKNADIKAAAAIDATKIADGSVSNAEFQYLDGVSSAIQTQLNAKQVTGNYLTALTGDAAATGPGSAALTFATVNGNVGSFGSATQAIAVTVNGKGLVTAASSTAIAIPFSQVSGTVPINQGGTGQTSASSAFNALSPMTTSGDIIYGGASGVGTRLPKGSNGQVLTLTSGVPSWTATSGSTPPLITNYLSGSGTHTFTGFPVYVRIRMVGAGGGGSGSSLSSAGNGGTGGNTTFGTSLLVANGGIGGVWASGGGTGGTASLGSGPTGMAISGSYGLGGQYAGAGTRISGGNGGNAPFFSGGGAGGDYSVAGFAGTTNTGGGGQGGGSNAIASIAGSGGGSGGFIDAVISGSTLSGLSGSAAYAIGAGGTAGTAGTLAGGPGADGQLEVTEYY